MGSNIESDANKLVLCIHVRDFRSFRQLVGSLKAKVERYARKFEEIERCAIAPLLSAMADRFERLQGRFSDGKNASRRAMEMVAMRRSIALGVLDGTLALSCVALGAVGFVLATTGQWHLLSGLLSSLAGGPKTRQQLRKMLSKLYEKEHSEHQKAANAFQTMESCLGSIISQMRSCEQHNTQAAKALEEFKETLETMDDEAEDAAHVSPPDGPVAEQALSEHIDSLHQLVATVCNQSRAMLTTLPDVLTMELPSVAQPSTNPQATPAQVQDEYDISFAGGLSFQSQAATEPLSRGISVGPSDRSLF